MRLAFAMGVFSQVEKMKKIILLLAFAGLFTACSSKEEVVPEPVVYVEEVSRPSYMQHEVKYSGETLGLIARWYTGRTDNWKRIADVNSSIKPQRISIGDIILIPMDIVSQSDPLPKKAVRSARRARPASSASEADVSTDSEVARPVSESVAQPVTKEASRIKEKSSSRDKLLDELLSQ